ncbi:MAG TPA: hypothetical protein VHE37_07350 [Nevskiaceae bacterium]|nr:hypothetical protein [Nevskiaceae bacterium]
MGFQGKGEPFYPTVFQRIFADIEFDRGEVFLVGAGMLGKLLCARIRDLGGIAMDVGSIMDHWAGFATRAESAHQYTRFDPAASLLAGQPFAAMLPGCDESPAPRCASDDTRRRNIAAELESLDCPLPTASHHFRVVAVGHPRCGSAYLTEVLRRLGLHIGHEHCGDDGICSWPWTVDDARPPYGTPPPAAAAARVDCLLAYVRDPAQAIPSIMLENTDDASFSFRRFHILRTSGMDIASYRTAMDRAVASYLGWMRIVDMRKPLAVIRIEHATEDLRAIAAALPPPPSADGSAAWADLADVPRTINSSKEKFAAGKPQLSAAQIASLDRDLARELDEFCARHHYAQWATSR